MLDRVVAGQGALAAHLLSLLAALVVLVRLDRGQWFWFDEWEWITNRRGGGANLGLLDPHNEHWSTIPILAWRAEEAVVGLRHYWPYMLVVILLHLVVAHLLWQLMVRAGCDRWVATGAVAAFLVLGGGFENLTWGFQAGFLASLALGLGALLILDIPDLGIDRRLVAGWGLLVLSLMSSGVGVTMCIVAGLAVLWRRGFRTAAIAVSVPAVVYVAWYAGWGHKAVTPRPSDRTAYLDVVDYAWTGLRNAAEAATGLTGAGTLLLAALLVAVYRERARVTGDRAAVAALALGAVISFVLTGIQRIAFGVDQATASRYVYIGAVFLLPAAVAGISLVSRSRLGLAVALVAVAACGVHGLDLLHKQARDLAAAKQLQRGVVTAAARIVAAGGPIVADPDTQVDPSVGPDLTVAKLRPLVADGEIPLTGLEPTPSQVVAAESTLQTAVSSDPAVPIEGTVRLLALTGASATSLQGDCLDITSGGKDSRIRFEFAGPAAIRVTPATGGTITLFLASATSPVDFAPPRDTPVAAGVPVSVRVAVGGTQPILALPAGSNRVCGLRP